VRQAVTGARRRSADTPFLTARHLWLHTDPPLDLDVHGEIRGRTPAQITLEANALRVMVRTDFPDVCGSPFAATIEDAAAAGQRDRTQPNRRVPGVAGRQLRNQAGRRPITVRPAGPNPAGFQKMAPAVDQW
jgi:hypothetical protein